MALSTEQIQQLYTARPDVQQAFQANPSKMSEAKRAGSWYDTYLKGGGKDLFGGTPSTAVSTIPGTQYPTFQAQPFSFDANQYLPEIQNQAQSIYQPQLQALESIRQVGKQTAETAKITSEKDFQKQMTQEIEAINSRGAFFSGGAKQYETGLQEQHQRDISTMALQAQASDFQNLAQQAGLSSEQTQFIQNQLYSAQGSAYQRYQDAYQNAFQNYQFNVNTAEQARQFDMNMQFDTLKYWQDLGLKKSEAKAAQEKFKLDVAKYGQQVAYQNASLALQEAKSGIGQYQYDTSQGYREQQDAITNAQNQQKIDNAAKNSNWWDTL